MDLKDMRALVAVAEAGTLSGAAERLHVAQPALTKRVQGLERALGVVLLERRARGVRLTEAGRAFVDGARDTLARAQAAADAARRAGDGEVGRLAVGYTDLVVYSGHLPTVVGAFRKRYPDVELALAPHRMPGPALDAFDAGALDVVLVQRWTELSEVAVDGRSGGHVPATPRAPWQAGRASLGQTQVDPDGRRTRMLDSCSVVVYLPAWHRLADVSSLLAHDLADEPFVDFPYAADRVHSERLRRACAAVGLWPRLVQEVADLAALFGLVAAGVGVHLGPEAQAGATPPGVAWVPVTDLPLRLALELRWREAPGTQLPANFASVAAAVDPPAGTVMPRRRS